MFFSRLALAGLALSLFQDIFVSSTIVPRQSNTPDNPASYLLGLINSLNTSAATEPAIPSTLPGPKYRITQKSDTPVLRASAISTKRLTFLYGPPVAGGPYFRV
jgi:hypothetical protein